MSFKADFTNGASATFAANFSGTRRGTFAASFGKVQLVTEPVDTSVRYEGEYLATPKVTEQTLPTKKRFLEKDVTVAAIPYFEASNTSGGKTVNIA